MLVAVGFSFNIYNYYQHPFNIPFQYNNYQQSCIEIHSPDGDHLESIGYEIQKQTKEEQTTQLQEQIVLLQSLCEKITQEVELPARAIAGLRDLLFRVRGVIK